MKEALFDLPQLRPDPPTYFAQMENTEMDDMKVTFQIDSYQIEDFT